ncbi:DNA helicase RecQ [Giardia muris]|uniref:DNA 3'-5' helicase n=1 Tax=Giardia muris TaxID=5742 RepID=A0A4Z1SXC7_GIAMU|nr:DNA helicase RecQ [Giardia muris]|eukprot:TNJ26353.1 DNA helicase RecQ [Giardia muris]
MDPILPASLRAHLDGFWAPFTILADPLDRSHTDRVVHGILRGEGEREEREQQKASVSGEDSEDSGDSLPTVSRTTPTLIHPGPIRGRKATKAASKEPPNPYAAIYDGRGSSAAAELYPPFDEEAFMKDLIFEEESYYLHALHSLGYANYRFGQRAVLCALNGLRKVLTVMPTGHGKSVLFVVPTLASRRVTLVVVPTIALQQDQLKKWSGKVPIKACGSGIGTGGDNAHTIKGRDVASIERGPLVLLVTPERLAIDKALQASLTLLAQTGALGLLVIDEAHLVLEWCGFRPEYSDLPQIFRELMSEGQMALLLLTATLTTCDSLSLMHLFGFQLDLGKEPLRRDQLFVCSAYRPNIQLNCVNFDPKLKELQDVVDSPLHLAISAHSSQTSIVYCRRREDNEALAQKLCTLFGTGFAEAYYSGKPALEAIFRRWLTGHTKCICGTIAFGMGIDKPDVRLVIDLDPSTSITHLLQKIGRCGRDGLSASAVLFFSVSSLLKTIRIVTNDGDQRALLDVIAVALFFLRDDSCRWRTLLRYFSQDLPLEGVSCGHCDVCNRPDHLGTQSPLPLQPFIQALLLTLDQAAGKLTITELVKRLSKDFSKRKKDAFSLSKEQVLRILLELVYSEHLELVSPFRDGAVYIRIPTGNSDARRKLSDLGTLEF